MFDQINSFIQNLPAFIAKSKFNVPQNVNNPDELINYLLQSRQLTQDQYNQAMRMAKNMGIKL